MTGAPTFPASPWLRVALAVSLVVNLFLVGAIVGAGLLSPHGARGPGRGRPVPPIWAAAQSLPAPERDAFRAMLKARAVQVRPDLRDAAAARRAAADLIAAPAYDAKTVGDLLARARADESRARGQVDAAFVDYLPRLSPADRAALSRALVNARLRQLARPGQGPRPPG